MQVLAMLRFQDLFVAQILGSLLSRKYIGMVNFLFEDERIPTCVWLNGAGITHVQRQNATNVDILYEILWLTQGKIGLYPKVSKPEVPPLNFPELIEFAAINLLPPLPISCPMLENCYLKRDATRMELPGTFSEIGRGIVTKIPYAGTELSRVRNITDSAMFWPTLIYLCSNGQVLCSYEQTVGRLLQKFEELLLVRLTAMFGARASVPFTDVVREILQRAWPDWVTGELPDPLYGAAPYYLWAKTLKSKISIVGMPTLTNRCFDQTIDKFSSTDAQLVRYLCNWLFIL